MRSQESIEKRKEYVRNWRKNNPDYHKTKHRQNREHENIVRRMWRYVNREKYLKWRRDYEQRFRKSRSDSFEIPSVFVGNEIFRVAESIVGARPNPALPYFQIWEELMGAVVLALVEGSDPIVALKEKKKEEFSSYFTTTYFYPNTDIDQDGNIVLIKRRTDEA